MKWLIVLLLICVLLASSFSACGEGRQETVTEPAESTAPAQVYDPNKLFGALDYSKVWKITTDCEGVLTEASFLFEDDGTAYLVIADNGQVHSAGRGTYKLSESTIDVSLWLNAQQELVFTYSFDGAGMCFVQESGDGVLAVHTKGQSLPLEESADMDAQTIKETVDGFSVPVKTSGSHELFEILNHTDVWSFRTRIDESAYDMDFLFEEDGKLYTSVGIWASEYVGIGFGTYEMTEDGLVLSIMWGNGNEQMLVYGYDAQEGCLIQESDVGYLTVHDMGDRFYIKRSRSVSADELRNLVQSYNGPYPEFFNFNCYAQKVTDPSLAIMSGPGYDETNWGTVGQPGIYIIAQERRDENGNVWGELLSGAGWIDLTKLREGDV